MAATEPREERRADQRAGVLRSSAVRLLDHPALVECSTTEAGEASAMTVVPLLDGNRIAGFEIRCGCGSSAIVECIYENEVQNG